MQPIDIELIAFTATILFLAYMVRGIAGFGSALIAVPMLALRFPLALVVPMVVTLDYLGSASQGFNNRDRIAWRDLWPLIPSTAVGTACALMLFGTVEGTVLTTVLGGFVIAFAVYQLLPTPDMKMSRLVSVPCGFLGGLLGTLFGTGGPFYVMYLNFRGLDKVALRATFASYFIMDGSLRLAGYTGAGLFDRDALFFLAAAIPVAALGLWLGGKVHLNLKQETYRRFISLILIGSGVGLLVKGLS